MTASDRDREAVVLAGEAVSDLNVFYIVISTLENGHLHAPSDAAAGRIIKICKSEAEKRLRDYDRYVAKAIEP
jgi:hypothetical protein